MLQLSDTYCEVPFIVHEFSTQACSPEPECILPRARLFRVRLAPDQLNPEGHYDADLSRVRGQCRLCMLPQRLCSAQLLDCTSS